MKLEKETTYVLKLSSLEARWLRALMQNPIIPARENCESTQGEEMRSKIFNTLKNSMREDI